MAFCRLIKIIAVAAIIKIICHNKSALNLLIRIIYVFIIAARDNHSMEIYISLIELKRLSVAQSLLSGNSFFRQVMIKIMRYRVMLFTDFFDRIFL